MPKPIVISDFGKGIADSPIDGFALFKNVEMDTWPNVARAAIRPVKRSGSTITGLVQWIFRDPTTGRIFALDSLHRLYKSTDGNSWTYLSGNNHYAGDAGQGMTVWNNYVFVIGAQRITLFDIAAEIGRAHV